MRTVLGVSLALSVFAVGQSASAQESVVEMVTKACEKEIDSYCSEVTPGDGRLLSCFYAHEDKLSVQCINALYDGMTTLERAVEAMAYVANQCRDDIDTISALRGNVRFDVHRRSVLDAALLLPDRGHNFLQLREEFLSTTFQQADGRKYVNHLDVFQLE